MKLRDRLRIWWRGIPPTITELENGGIRLTYQDPNHPPARDRFMAAMHRPFIKWLCGAIGAVAIAVIAAAIGRWLGAS